VILFSVGAIIRIGLINPPVEIPPPPPKESAAAELRADFAPAADPMDSHRCAATRSMPPPAAEVLYNDLLNRPHDFLMPFLAGLADMPGHARQLESSETLEILYGQPAPGVSWSAHIAARMA
jgi:hypothetical protein